MRVITAWIMISATVLAFGGTGTGLVEDIYFLDKGLIKFSVDGKWYTLKADEQMVDAQEVQMLFELLLTATSINRPVWIKFEDKSGENYIEQITLKGRSR
jgi:hypothetical protein